MDSDLKNKPSIITRGFVICVAIVPWHFLNGILIAEEKILVDKNLSTEIKHDAAGAEFFENHIRPVLVKQCYECHSAESKTLHGNLRLDVPWGLTKGGDSGPVLIAGQPETSLLLESLRYESYEMPPKGKLPPETIAKFETWIKQGAYDPRPQTTESPHSKVIDINKGKEFWCFQPLGDVQIPTCRNETWCQGHIDHFIQEQLEKHNLTTSPRSKPLELLRRVTYDLAGRPPLLGEIQNYLADNTPHAYEHVVDRLLASPEFGERFGRFWMDVARYADSNGADRNFIFYDAWRYRDYIIKSFNEDKPFDEFLIQQIAGDLLPYDNDEQRTENLVATGYLLLGTKMLTERDKEKLLRDVADEQLDTIGKGLLGMTISCARCHDHKFDPIPQKDYYALAGILTNTRGLGDKERAKFVSDIFVVNLPMSRELQEQVRISEEKLKSLEAERDVLTKSFKNREEKMKEMEKQMEQSQEVETTTADMEKITNIKSLLEQIEFIKSEVQETKKKLAVVDESMKEVKAKTPNVPKALAVRDDSKIEDMPLAIRGDHHRAGEVVPRGFLSVCSYAGQPTIPVDQSGRKELAQWIAHPKNPLTSRVAVNRIWQHFFGTGIVSTPENFGQQGARPTHPELLRYLAQRYIDLGWSTKKLVREVVMSGTYKSSTIWDDRNARIDPENKYLWRMPRRRLDAEQIRDAMLVVSEDLKQFPGGTFVKDIKDGTSPVLNSRDYLVRSIYLPILRGSILPELEIFNTADADVVSPGRSQTSVPSQALLMMNSPFVWDRSTSLAKTLLLKYPENTTERIVELYLKLLTRFPTQDEISAAQSFLQEIEPLLKNQKVSPELLSPELLIEQTWAALSQSILGCSEFRYLE